MYRQPLFCFLRTRKAEPLKSLSSTTSCVVVVKSYCLTILRNKVIVHTIKPSVLCLQQGYCFETFLSTHVDSHNAPLASLIFSVSLFLNLHNGCLSLQGFQPFGASVRPSLPSVESAVTPQSSALQPLLLQRCQKGCLLFILFRVSKKGLHVGFLTTHFTCNNIVILFI